MAHILSSPQDTFRFIMTTARDMFRPGSNGIMACVPIPPNHVTDVRKMFSGHPLEFHEQTALDALWSLTNDSMKDVGTMLAAMQCAATPEELELAASDPIAFRQQFEILDFMGQKFAVSIERFASLTGLPMTAEKYRYAAVRLIEANGRTVMVVFDPTMSGDITDFPTEPFLELAQTRAGSGFDVGRGYSLPVGINLETLMGNPLFNEAIGVYPVGYNISLRRDGDYIYASI